MWGVAVAHARALTAAARSIRDDSVVLKVRAQQSRGARSIRGSSDDSLLAVLIASMILERPTCLLCIAEKVNADQLAVVRTMEQVGLTIQVVIEDGERCRACGSSLGPVYSLLRRA